MVPAIVAALALTLAAPAAQAAPPPSASPAAPLAAATAPAGDSCTALAARLDPAIFAAAEAAPVAATTTMPAYCRVRGTIRPTIGFEMRLPASGWNGNYYVSGCGGYCGVMTTETPGFANGIVEAVRRGYAAIHTDSGHQGTSQGDSDWARGNRQALELYAHGWLPLAHAAGLAIVRGHYGREARYRYFVGCSNGGRMALIAAQRYPRLFHGIISGCPAVDLTTNGGAFGAWKLHTNRDSHSPVLTPAFAARLPLLMAEVNRQCDRRDGAADGLVARPDACRVDLSRIASCRAGHVPAPTDRCLTTAEKTVIRQWYQGPVDSRGRRVFWGMPVGSEAFWKVWYLRDPATAVGTQLADGFVRDIVWDPRHPDFGAASFDYDRDPARLRRDFALLNADNPDLSEFRAAGGRLIMWHGAADPLVLPAQTADYYRRVAARMGGTARVQQFFRFFLAPGLGHCWEAPPAVAPEEFDPMTAIAAWVEQGQAPDALVARPSARQGGATTIAEIRYRPWPLQPIVVAAPR